MRMQLLVVMLVAMAAITVCDRTQGDAARQCENDAQDVIDQCKTKDQAECCSAFAHLLSADGGCVCDAAAAGSFEPLLLYEDAMACNTTIPASLLSCLAGLPGTSGGSNNTGSTWISLLVVLLLSLAISINT
ncbi:hypothetical protein GOP47_0028054 [Adiantum capillus-veneris]|nr:hypothetical protein GOP47_0028054 [Adiantum capillus-veneris]